MVVWQEGGRAVDLGACMSGRQVWGRAPVQRKWVGLAAWLVCFSDRGRRGGRASRLVAGWGRCEIWPRWVAEMVVAYCPVELRRCWKNTHVCVAIFWEEFDRVQLPCLGRFPGILFETLVLVGRLLILGGRLAAL